MSRPKQRKSGEPITPNSHQQHTIYCCDCGLAHLFTYEVDESGQVVVTAYADLHNTKEERKRRGIVGVRYKKGGKSKNG